ncbi:hypothetical protein F5Y19DRAFT_399369 [Xylariaceae sp. FL1651]|nr:hypothetical protein F5Y19DRAFT_399369 [Xylariaceae sp. FL1651]
MAKSNRVIEQEPKPRIIDERFEMRLAAIVRGAEQRGSTFSDADVNEIRDILLKAGKKTWSARPRTYAVLLMAGALDLMDEFVKLELSDYNFPYKIGRIPLCVKGPTLRQSFFNKQTVVLTDIKGAERGQHSYLATNADPHFEILDRLGKGGQALVEKVRSKLSLRDYARKSFVRGRKFEGSESETSFKNELQNLKRLSHLHLVQYIGSSHSSYSLLRIVT